VDHYKTPGKLTAHLGQWQHYLHIALLQWDAIYIALRPCLHHLDIRYWQWWAQSDNRLPANYIRWHFP
jgi:hypothetical protein